MNPKLMVGVSVCYSFSCKYIRELKIYQVKREVCKLRFEWVLCCGTYELDISISNTIEENKEI